MTEFDRAVIAAQQRGHTAEQIATMLAQSLGRVIAARRRDREGRLTMAAQAMISMRDAMP